MKLIEDYVFIYYQNYLLKSIDFFNINKLFRNGLKVKI